MVRSQKRLSAWWCSTRNLKGLSPRSISCSCTSYLLALLAILCVLALLPISSAARKKPKAKVSQSRHELRGVYKEPLGSPGASDPGGSHGATREPLESQRQSKMLEASDPYFDVPGCLQVKGDSETALDDSSLTVEIQHAIGEGM